MKRVVVVEECVRFDVTNSMKLPAQSFTTAK